ncbi:MAG: SCP2 sterol-binding domain-containing protein [Acidimicrobiaceae bacterium]|nr:SCP2 sterol-binding domain-containing protein [Acidimicrobiaceae bacterium]MXW76768.1 SCP2 sterol-binding domain-containing protein [Acidimicrobiaceae bacterium]MYA76003.1 SCP2 sterol-binding domain-containing protein [Acidimicrobiaceae bacterium]MYC43593.1 SCP2 sterol-binding domain-containing protein [Acidimicrobiaceae bacterium]MYD06892.1 SCP2 sterol-binding domain-containing protein [Acidimicrobiaceae bacterium]
MQLFGEEWIAAANEALAGLPAVSGLDAVIEYTISGRPIGRTSLTVTLVDGVFSGIALGKSKECDIAISMNYSDAVAILSGELTSDAGYMSGAVKVEGDYPLWLLDLRPVRVAAIDVLAPLMVQTSSE